MKASYIYLDDQIIPSNSAKINIDERGFLFGDGIFETIRFQNSQIYNFNNHLKRLESGLKSLKINYNPQQLLIKSQNLIAKNQQKNGILRIYISRGSGSTGYQPNSNAKPLLLIEIKELPTKPKTPIILGLSSYQKPSLKSLPTSYKYAANLNSILVKITAAEHNNFDDIILNDQGHICETSSYNIFWIQDDILHTPNLNCGLLAGCIRDKIIKLSPLKINFCQSPISTLQNVQEIFISNSAHLLLKVDKLSFINKRFPSQKYYQIFLNLLKQDIVAHEAQRPKVLSS